MAEPEIPPLLEQLWGLRGPSRRGGPKPALSVDRIVTAAMELVDAGGLAALSMSRLAEKLGFTTMSLYRHVASKDDLLVLLLDVGIGPPPDGPTAVGWRAGCAEWAWTLLEIYRRHPWAVELPISALPAGPNQLAWFERGLAALAETRLDLRERASSVLLLAMYVRSQAQLGLDLVKAGRAAAVAGADAPPEWTALVRRLADPVRFPELTKVIQDGVLDDDPEQAAGYPDDEFHFGLQRILDGIEALHRSRVAG